MALVDKLGMEEVDLLGHSFGGRIAIRITATQPERIHSLILIDSAGIRHYEAGWRFRFITCLTKLGKPIILRLPNPLRARVRWRFYQAINSTDYLTAGRLSETYNKVVSEDLEPALPQIRVPTLLLWGEKDHETPLRDGRVMVSRIPNAKLVILPGAGHFSFLDRPGEANQALDDFLFKSNGASPCGPQ
jgi:pimeloyl-ACP methyl ester carboxylesterase